MWVLDILGSLTKKTSLDAQIRHLRTLTDIDNVHLTTDGYKAVAAGILEACKKLANTKDTAVNTVSAVIQQKNWRSFETYEGVGGTARLVVKTTGRMNWLKFYQPAAFCGALVASLSMSEIM